MEDAKDSYLPGTFLAQLSQDDRDAVLRLGVRRRVPGGATLMAQGEFEDRVIVLLEGRVKVSRIDLEGRELMLEIRDAGDLLGELAFIDRESRVAAVSTLEPVVAVVIPSGAFRLHLERAPRVGGALRALLARRMREATASSMRAATADTTARLAERILQLADRYGVAVEDGVMVELPVSQVELASWIGASRAGVAQSLQLMRQLGWIETRRRTLVVKDRVALSARAAM